MGVIIGIDVGGSTTKIVGFRDGKNMCEETMITPLFVRATDPLTSLYGAFGKYTAENSLSLSDIECIMITGVGSTFMQDKIYDLPCVHCAEFDCNGLGGLFLSKLDRAVVASLGTGTSLVYAEKDKSPVYLGGTGVGGGTISGLSKKLFGIDDMEELEKLASTGNLENIDLYVGDMTKKDMGGISSKLTAANFGNISGLATNSDMAIGLINMVYETVGMMAIFASRLYGIKDIVLTGNLTTMEPAPKIFEALSAHFNINFLIPKYSQFSTVIGAALAYKK